MIFCSPNSSTIRYPLSKILCKQKPTKCPQLNGMFSYKKNWVGGECGVVDSRWCAGGKGFVSTDYRPYYAYCVQQI